MDKVVVSRKILSDAYNNAFINLERMNYSVAERLLNFVEENDYPVESDMVDYAKVIIFSNSRRIDKAIELSDEMLKRGIESQELQKIIRDVHRVLEKQQQKKKAHVKINTSVSIDQANNFLQQVAPSESKVADFIEAYCDTSNEENEYLQFRQSHKLTDSKDNRLLRKTKSAYFRARRIESQYNTVKGLSDNRRKRGYLRLGKRILMPKSNFENLIFLRLHRLGILKEMLLDQDFDQRVRSVIGYQLAKLYRNGMIGRIGIKMIIGEHVYEERIDNLSNVFMLQSNKLYRSYEKFLTSPQVPQEFVPVAIDSFEHMTSMTFPTVNPLNIDADKYVCAFLYVISNNNYKSHFNDIIEDVYNFKQHEVQTEIEMLEVLLLIYMEEKT